jgi:hypothetical protein
MSVSELVFITIIVELLEVYLQYSKTLKESLLKMYSYYQKSPFLFYITNLGYIWLLFITILYNNFNFAIALGIMLKTFDIYTKISLMQKVFIKPNSQYLDELSLFLDAKMPIWIYLIGVITYPYIVYVSFN